MPSKYAQFAEQAHFAVEQSSDANQECRCPGNLELVLFLGFIKDFHRREETDGSIGRNIIKTYASAKQHPSRICKVDHIKDLNGAGPTIAKIIQDNLWLHYPPEPQCQEERDLEERQQQAAADEKKRRKEFDRKRKAETKAAEAVAAARGECTGGAGPDPLRGGLFDENGRRCTDTAGHEAGAQPSNKKAKTGRTKKEYIPQFGSANYVFLLMLLKHLRNGKTFMTKSELMDTADESGLSHKPIKGATVTSHHGGPPTGFQHAYDGWSNFKLLVNKEPPLCVAYSAPKKIRLTAEGEDLALRLYRDGVASDRITWRIPVVSLDQSLHSLSQTQGLSQPQAAPSPALPRAPAQAFRSATHASHRRGSQNRPTPPSVGGSQANPFRGRALEPEGAVNSPRQSWHATSSARPSAAQPNGTAVRAAPIHCDLLSHPSSSFQVAEDMPDLSTRLSQSVTQSRPLTQIAPQREPARHPTGAEAPLERHASAGKPPLRSRDEEQILRVMQIAECSYNKAKRALSAYTTVEAALNQIWDLSGSDSDGGDDLVNAGSQHQQRHSKAAHYEPPMAASQSEDLLATANHGQAGRGSRPAPRPPAQAAPASALLPHSASFNRDLGAQRQLSQGQGSLDRQGSSGSGSSLGRASSMAGPGAAGPSRLGAPIQGRASGLSQQATQGTGHVAAAPMESSGNSWKLPFHGAEGNMEETDIRLPPLPPGACFSEEYEVVLILDSREQYSNVGKNRIESLSAHLQMVRSHYANVEVRELKVGDVVWIARSRHDPQEEYVLDYILERKRVDDLYQSIKSENRYDKQKWRMHQCGLRHLVYLVEGDPDTLDETAAKAVKTASMQTEVVDGFQILRSNRCNETMVHLANWSKAISRKYGPLRAMDAHVQSNSLLSFQAFKAQAVAEDKKKTVQDVWALMLTTVPGWSHVMVDAVVRQYATPLSLFQAYKQVMQSAARQGRSPLEAGRHLLVSCQLSKSRRPISLNNSAKVFDTLFANGWQCV